MSLYKLVCVFVLASATVKGIVYQGCYEDNRIKRVLPYMLVNSPNNNTPADCARRCSDYRYAGVQYWSECYCGNTLNATLMPESECRLSCPGDKRTKCGGHSMISIYTNWACGPPPTIANGNVTLRKGINVTYGSIADIFCGSGLIKKGTITCLSNTSWEQTTCEQPKTETVSTMSTVRVVTTNSSTHEGSTTAVYVGIGVAVGLVCAVGAVIVIIVLRRRGAFACKNGKNTDTNDTSAGGSHTLGIRPHDKTCENQVYFVQSFKGTVDHYNSAEPAESNCDADHYYSTEVTDQTYERMPDGNDEYDHTTNTLSSESDSRKRDNIYNKPKIERHGAYDHTGRLENNMTRTGDDYDTTQFVGRNDDVSDYNHVVSTTVTRGYGKNNYEQGGYDLFHGIKTKLPQCDDTDYAHANI